jgi:hypothetical protein
VPRGRLPLAELITTFLHFDRFRLGTPPFYIGVHPLLIATTHLYGVLCVSGTTRQVAGRSAHIQYGGLLVIEAVALFFFPD